MLINDKIAKTSAMYIGYLILDGIRKLNKDKISIYDISDYLKKRGVNSSRQLVLGLSFLYSVDIVEFEEANIWIKK
ncbi:MAG: hypothetical protein WBJ13_09385 [Sedimentibacter sp.]